MELLGVAVLVILALVPQTSATTCDACHTTYDGAVTAATTDTAKCTALTDLFTCLDTSAKADAGCPLTAARITAINTVISGLTTACAKFTKACACQKNFWLTDMTAGDSAICSAAKTYILCVKASPMEPCDGAAASPATSLATSIETRINALGTACPLTFSCQCEIARAKTSVATSAEKCTAYQEELNCFGVTSSVGCDGTTARYTLAAATNTELKALTGPVCSPSATCLCEINLAVADNGDRTKVCSAIATAYTCLNAVSTSTSGCNSCMNTDILKGIIGQTKTACDSDGASALLVTPVLLAASLLTVFVSELF